LDAHTIVIFEVLATHYGITINFWVDNPLIPISGRVNCGQAMDSKRGIIDSGLGGTKAENQYYKLYT